MAQTGASMPLSKDQWGRADGDIQHSKAASFSFCPDRGVKMCAVSVQRHKVMKVMSKWMPFRLYWPKEIQPQCDLFFFAPWTRNPRDLSFSAAGSRTFPVSSIRLFAEKASQPRRCSRMLCVCTEEKKKRRCCFSFLKFVIFFWAEKCFYTNSSLICANRANHLGLISGDRMLFSISLLLCVFNALRSAFLNINILPALALKGGGNCYITTFHALIVDERQPQRLAGYRCVSSDSALHFFSGNVILDSD